MNAFTLNEIELNLEITLLNVNEIILLSSARLNFHRVENPFKYWNRNWGHSEHFYGISRAYRKTTSI